MKSRVKMAALLVMVIVIVGIFWIFYATESPQGIFEDLVVKPIPKSVTSLEEGHFLALDSVFRVLHFQTSKSDLDIILGAGRFVPIDEEKEFKRWDTKLADYTNIVKAEYFDQWKQRIFRMVKLNVNLTTNWQVSTVSEGHGNKYLFFDTNRFEVVWIAEAH